MRINLSEIFDDSKTCACCGEVPHAEAWALSRTDLARPVGAKGEDGVDFVCGCITPTKPTQVVGWRAEIEDDVGNFLASTRGSTPEEARERAITMMDLLGRIPLGWSEVRFKKARVVVFVLRG